MVDARSTSQASTASGSIVSVERGSPLPTSPGRNTLPPELLLPTGFALPHDFAARITDEDPGLIMLVNKHAAQAKSGMTGAAAEQVLVGEVLAAGMQASAAGTAGAAAVGLAVGPNTSLHLFSGTMHQLLAAFMRLNSVPWAHHTAGSRDAAAMFSISGGGNNIGFQHYTVPFQA